MDEIVSAPRGAGADKASADRFERIGRTEQVAEAVRLVADSVLSVFDDYYNECRRISWRAKDAFERRNPAESVELSRRRLTIYSKTIRHIAARLNTVFPRRAGDEPLWREVEAAYMRRVAGRYEADLAAAYIHSVRRILYQDEWKPVEYSFGTQDQAAGGAPVAVHRELPGGSRFTPELVIGILEAADLTGVFQNLEEDAALAAGRINRDFGFAESGSAGFDAVHVVKSGFYRNRGAYVVGRIRLPDGEYRPLVLSLENHTGGIFVDAVLTCEADAHNLFSSTLANFHVTIPHYHELSAFLYTIMPRRPLGQHYSTIGFNHVGKVAVVEEMERELTDTGATLDNAVGFRGTVAIGFSTPSLGYVLKVIRDAPTEQYKWGEFQGIASVLDKREYDKERARDDALKRTGGSSVAVPYGGTPAGTDPE